MLLGLVVVSVAGSSSLPPFSSILVRRGSVLGRVVGSVLVSSVCSGRLILGRGVTNLPFVRVASVLRPFRVAVHFSSGFSLHLRHGSARGDGKGFLISSLLDTPLPFRLIVLRMVRMLLTAVRRVSVVPVLLFLLLQFSERFASVR